MLKTTIKCNKKVKSGEKKTAHGAEMIIRKTMESQSDCFFEIKKSC